ncbi:DUF2800 domain-containing protein [Methylobacterium brachiatum]|uniref:DUF2800 domain-containing protein n=1 Tax=Methylobacterium brachiatum TaxID=269660 RepID=UPI0008F34981|nr:DUF2800 domain-containing protein [Methylobacterium brachiatum]SFI05166.1 Protein of unknown function [Methylobacterium brachiatum]
MSAGHAQRDHAQWPASASARLWACAGSLALSGETGRADSESEAAAWGTACHEVAEDCLRTEKAAAEWIGRFVTTKRHRIEVDEELAETAQVYIDYVTDAAVFGIKPLWIERRFSLEAIHPPFEAGGTADAVIFHDGEQLLEVVDLKGGRGIVVEALGNKQARTYALGAVLAFPGLDIQHVKVTIVQPRAPHRDGPIRSETFHIADLIDWTGELLEAMGQAKAAETGLHGALVDNAAFDAWARTHLASGDHCTFCPCAGTCPALANAAMAKAHLFFKDESGAEQENTVGRLTTETIAEILDHADMIQNWLNAVRAHAHAQTEAGVEIPNYQLVPKVGRERWNDGVEADVIAACVWAELPDDQFRNAPKLRTPKQIRKALGPHLAKLVEKYSTVPTAGTSLVRQDKTVRNPVKPKAHQLFDIIDD